jgi:dynein light chain 4, axonemal
MEERERCYSFILSRTPHETIKLKVTSKFCPQHSDMSEEMRTEAMELSVTACEKFSQNNELAARMVKESMDKKFGPAFHVVVGESYGFEITYECTTICYMYFGGNQAICIWKCS